MGLYGSYAVGQYSASAPSEAHVAVTSRPYVPNGTARPVLWFHSAGGTGVDPWLASNNVLPIWRAVTSLGLPILSADTSGDAWGNDTAQSRANDMRSFIQSAAYLQASSAKAILMGVSMGGMLALNWARANPTLTQCVVLFYPAVNLQAIHDGTGGATAGAATTEAAYGGSLATFNAAVTAHDPAQNAASYTGVPIYMGYSNSDTVVGTANQTSFITAVGGSALTTRVYAGAGHADMTKVNAADVQSFLVNYV